MTFSPGPTNPATTFTVRGLARRPNGELFVTLNNGEIYRAAASSNQLTRLPNVPAQTGSTLLGPIGAFGQDVIVFRGSSAHFCTGACTDFNDFNPLHTLTFPEEPSAICASDAAAFVTTNAGSTGKLGKIERGTMLTYTEVAANAGVGNVEKCQVGANGDVFVAGDSAVAVLLAGGGLGSETIDLMGQPGSSWRDVATRAASGFLVGGGSGFRSATRASAAWTSLMPDTSGTVLTSVAMLSETEALAGGIVNSGSSTTPGILRWNGVRFAPFTPAPPVFEVEHAVTVSANEVYFAGYERTSGGYVIVHGTRP